MDKVEPICAAIGVAALGAAIFGGLIVPIFAPMVAPARRVVGRLIRGTS